MILKKHPAVCRQMFLIHLTAQLIYPVPIVVAQDYVVFFFIFIVTVKFILAFLFLWLFAGFLKITNNISYANQYVNSFY